MGVERKNEGISRRCQKACYGVDKDRGPNGIGVLQGLEQVISCFVATFPKRTTPCHVPIPSRHFHATVDHLTSAIMADKAGAYGAKAADTDFRKKWDKEEYAARAKKKDDEERERMKENEERLKQGALIPNTSMIHELRCIF